ncbi:non-ribosomal peptide synthetase [Mangrovihabitans endophyticus]|uniref:Carrier domain-containing protein n=1 Tax=Mangrovihabitans endophyticus TaxID=1751298 RepID=A0A8J3FLR8_9ACTN|nr:non-ribosomal peptide synthetase [Mangrovihabitans endophyticus]GGK78996.1 hypothetical protein GCM10012284_11210 [Mangrovihabitans endophyticus]
MAEQVASALSSAEQRLWFQWQLRPDGAEYNTPLAYRLTGPLDVPALRRAVDELAARHEVLRTRYPATGGVSRHVDPPGPVPWTSTDLRRVAPAQRESRVGEVVHAAAGTPFDLTAGPVFRAVLIEVGAADHVLVLVFHHIVVDGWSLEIITRDLRDLYTGRTPEPAGRYADFIAAEQRMLAGPRPARALAFWREYLAGAPAELTLPNDRPAPPNPGHGAGAHPFTLPASVLDTVRAVVREQRVTPFLIMLSAYAVTLATTTGSRDVVIGVPAAGRSGTGTENTVGLFINMLPIRVRVGPRTTFADLVREVMASFVSAYEFEDVPFQRLVEELAPPRTGDRHPVFQTAFSYQDGGGCGLELTGLTAHRLAVPGGTAKYELTLDATWGPDHTAGSIGYRTDMVDAGVAALIAERFCHVMATLTADPGCPLGSLPMLPPDEAALLLGLGGQPPLTTEPVHTAVRRHAVERPGTLAVADGDTALTYEHLDRAATRLAGELTGAGASGPDAVVAVCLPRGAELVTAVLGVLYTGAAYLPLDPAHPVHRRRTVLDEAAPVAAVVTSAAYGPDFPDHPVLGVPPVAGNPPAVPGARTGGRAYVIFTSGSTGRPKGVAVGHAPLANLVAWYGRTVGLRPGDRTALVAAPGFDASALEIWGALAAGATLDVAPPESLLSPVELRDWLVRRNVTHTFLPTPLAERLAALRWPPDSALRTVLAGGDRLRRPTPPGPPFTLLNGYGPTESTVAATYASVDPTDERAPSIGRPLPGVRALVLDGDLRLTPVGLVGELYLGGSALAFGYVGRPGATAEKFVPDPYGPPGARLYRTGDLVRVRPDGMLHFAGRNDTQVKVRGFRIEPAEIEDALRGQPGVRDAIAVVEPGPGDDGVLTAYLVPSGAVAPDAVAPDAGVLRRRLAEVLPQYMVPARLCAVEGWPLTANGKLDRAALRRDATELAGHRDVRTLPQNPMEMLVAAVWAEVLGHDAITSDDNFFDLGGHSLQLMTIRDRLARDLGRPVPIVTLYEHPTVRALARHLGQAAPGRHEPAPTPARESEAGLRRLASLRTARGRRSER